MAGPLLLLLAVAAAAGVFWFGLVSLGQAWATPEYSHGPVIPLLSSYLFLREMRRLPPVAAVHDRGTGVAVVLAALALGVLGNLVRIPDIVTYAMILWIWGLVLTVFGLRRGRHLWPGVLHLVFMLPLPQFVYWQLSVFLQSVSSEIGVGVIAWLGVPVYLEGNVIDLGVYKLQVAEACSGLRYLFPIMSFSYVFSMLYMGPRWHKAVLLLAAAPVTVLMNAFRIGMIGVLVDRFGIGQAEGFLHAFEGWIIFLACIAILFALAVLMQRTTRHPQPIAETLDIDFGMVGPELRRFAAIRPSRGLAAAALATLAVALAGQAAPERARVVPERAPLVLFPATLGAWHGSAPQRLDPEIERVLGADDYLAVDYDRPGAVAPVALFVAYYDRQTEGSGIHSPEVCLPAGGWEVSAWQQTRLAVPAAGGPIAVDANRAVIRKGLARQLVLFWFEQRGRRMSSAYAAKAVTVWDSLTRGRTDGGLVRLITPIRPDETPAAAEARLVDFLGAALPALPRFVPQ